MIEQTRAAVEDARRQAKASRVHSSLLEARNADRAGVVAGNFFFQRAEQWLALASHLHDCLEVADKEFGGSATFRSASKALLSLSLGQPIPALPGGKAESDALLQALLDAMDYIEDVAAMPLGDDWRERFLGRHPAAQAAIQATTPDLPDAP